MIAPIETIYHGYRFRSRLEARWAVFFDHLAIVWQYENEGFDLNGCKYLPDFYLQDSQCFVEIKAKEPTKEEIIKARLLHEGTGNAVVILYGDLYDVTYSITQEYFCGISARIFPEEFVEKHFDKMYPRENGLIAFRSFIAHLQMIEIEMMVNRFKNKWPKFVCDFGLFSGQMYFSSHDIMDAVKAARQARFAHGENGTP